MFQHFLGNTWPSKFGEFTCQSQTDSSVIWTLIFAYLMDIHSLVFGLELDESEGVEDKGEDGQRGHRETARVVRGSEVGMADRDVPLYRHSQCRVD